MSESSSKRPPLAPVAEAPRPTAAPLAPRPTAAPPAVTAPVPAAPPVPRPQPVFARKGNPTAMPGPVALFDAFAHGAEAFADEMAGLAQTGFANAAETAKAMFGAKSFTEAFEINAGFVQKSLDTMLTGSLRLTDITARLAEEALQPLMPGR
jgi:hypothetical protein